MMKQQIKITSTGHYVPSKVVTNDDLSKIMDTSDEWIYTRTGIKERRFVEQEDVVDLAYKAALNAIAKDKNQTPIDLIVVGTMTSKIKTPSVANLVQSRLGLNDQVLTSFDVNAACSGFIYAFEVASSLITAGNYNKALVIGAEHLSSVIDFNSRGTSVLFGDGAGAVIIEKSDDEADQVWFSTGSKGDDKGILWVDPNVRMSGKDVFKFAVDIIPKSIESVLLKSGLTIHDIDAIIPHQANMRMITYVSKSTGIDIDKFQMNIKHYGNTSSASIPILLDEYMNQGHKNQKLLLVGFGGGFTWGSIIINI